MDFLDFRKKSLFKFLLTCLSILFILNILPFFSSSSKLIKKTEDQNIVFLDLNSATNILIDNYRPVKRIFDKTTGIRDIGNYLDNSLSVVFKKYFDTIENNLSLSNSSRQFITVIYSTDI
jgi:hypothetical protein